MTNKELLLIFVDELYKIVINENYLVFINNKIKLNGDIEKISTLTKYYSLVIDISDEIKQDCINDINEHPDEYINNNKIFSLLRQICETKFQNSFCYIPTGK